MFAREQNALVSRSKHVEGQFCPPTIGYEKTNNFHSTGIYWNILVTEVWLYVLSNLFSLSAWFAYKNLAATNFNCIYVELYDEDLDATASLLSITDIKPSTVIIWSQTCRSFLESCEGDERVMQYCKLDKICRLASTAACCVASQALPEQANYHTCPRNERAMPIFFSCRNKPILS